MSVSNSFVFIRVLADCKFAHGRPKQTLSPRPLLQKKPGVMIPKQKRQYPSRSELADVLAMSQPTPRAQVDSFASLASLDIRPINMHNRCACLFAPLRHRQERSPCLICCGLAIKSLTRLLLSPATEHDGVQPAGVQQDPTPHVFQETFCFTPLVPTWSRPNCDQRDLSILGCVLISRILHGTSTVVRAITDANVLPQSPDIKTCVVFCSSACPNLVTEDSLYMFPRPQVSC